MATAFAFGRWGTVALAALAMTPLAALAMTPLVADGDAAPQVTLATPGMTGGAIARWTIRFSQPMVPLGDPRAAAPVVAKCAVTGEGRWVDQQTYVWAFATPLPGGTTCSFTTRAGLKSVAGYALARIADLLG